MVFLRPNLLHDCHTVPRGFDVRKTQSGSDLTENDLSQTALTYLSRYAASEDAVRRVLRNKIRRYFWEIEKNALVKARMDELCEAVETIIGQLRQKGILNDRSFAEMKIHSLRRMGKSRQYIAQVLQQRLGVEKKIVWEILNEGGDDNSQTELDVALVWMQKKKLGGFRIKGKEKDHHKNYEKDLRSLMRAGFDVTTARKALEASQKDTPS